MSKTSNTRTQVIKDNIYPRSLSDMLVALLMAGIPIYALINSFYHQSLIYLSYFLWFAIAMTLFQVILRYGLNPGYRLLILGAIWMSIAGRVYFYENIPFFDKTLHLLTPFLVACIAYDLTIAKKIRKPLITSFFITALLLFLFEIFEYLLDYYSFFEFNTRGVYVQNQVQIMSPVLDTIYDLFFGITSALAGVLLHQKNKQIVKTSKKLLL